MKTLHATSIKSLGDMSDEKNVKKFVSSLFPYDRKIVMSKLEQGTNINVVLESTAPIETLPTAADGLITSRPDMVLAVKGADCFPIFFIDEVGQRIGVAHCGWKGVLHSLPMKMIKQMQAEGSELKNIRVVIGPGIRSCHFEVQNDVWEKFYDKNPTLPQKFINLPIFIKIDLAHAGIYEKQIKDEELCTYCAGPEGKEVYFSHRRGKINYKDEKSEVDSAFKTKHNLSIIGFQA